ncbi:MAG: agmatinase [Planctomycetota bacterium]|jgi:agmatinase
MEDFLGEPCAVEAAGAVLVPVPYEKTTTYRKGTAEGPAALLEASTQIELFDAETRRTPHERGIATLGAVTCDGMPDALAERLAPVVGSHMDAGRLVGCLGGEHSISLGPIRAAADRHPGLGVLQVDAHPDLRDDYEGTRFGHGCVMRRVLEHPGIGTLVPVGLRAVSHDDDQVIASDQRVQPFYAYELSGDWVERVVSALPEHVYISFDLDGLDPSILPGTGTPEPGGLGWWDALRLLRAVAKQRKIIGFDVVELIPEAVSNFVAAKLVFKLLAYA